MNLNVKRETIALSMQIIRLKQVYFANAE